MSLLFINSPKQLDPYEDPGIKSKIFNHLQITACDNFFTG